MGGSSVQSFSNGHDDGVGEGSSARLLLDDILEKGWQGKAVIAYPRSSNASYAKGVS